VLEALGNLGDFIGGIAVVATLIYLAVQVRQNTLQLRESAKITRIQARDTAFQSFSDFREKIVSNADVAALYLEGLRDPDTLGPVERLRFNLLASELFHILHTSTYRIEQIRADDIEEPLRELGIESILRAPGMVKWWQRHRGEFRPDFASLIDGYIERWSEAG
jgi:hypothetical protein